MLCHFCPFSAVPESQEDKRFLVLLKVPAVGKQQLFVLFLTLDHQDLLVQTHWFRPGLLRPAAFVAFIPVGVWSSWFCALLGRGYWAFPSAAGPAGRGAGRSPRPPSTLRAVCWPLRFRWAAEVPACLVTRVVRRGVELRDARSKNGKY